MDRSTLSMIWNDWILGSALLAMMHFWFLGGVTLPAVNALGKDQLGLPETVEDTAASLLAACMGLGIAAGCLYAGAASKHKVSFRLVRIGSTGMAILFALLATVPYWGLDGTLTAYLAGAMLVGLGVCAGIFAVPLQVVLQARPSADQKGRMIGTMNLCTWLGILASAGFYGFCASLFGRESISLTFGILAALILPVAIFYRPADQELSAGSTEAV